MNFDMKEIANHMKELEIKASKYDDLKENLEKTMGLINDKFSEIRTLLSDISPMLSIKKHYGGTDGSWGNLSLEYIEKCYKYLIEHPDEPIKMSALKSAVDLDSVQGGSEHTVRKGLLKLSGISFSKMCFTYTKKTEIPSDLPKFIRETIKKPAEVGEMKIDEDDESIGKALPKRYSQMGQG